MRIRVARTDRFAVATVFLVLGLIEQRVSAQDNAAPPASSAPQPAAAAPAATGGADQGNAAAAATGLDYLYNQKPVDGSLAGQAADANDEMIQRAKAADALNYGRLSDPQLRERFDQFLTTAEVPAATLAAYETEMQRVSALLQENQTFAAWKELFTLAQYESIDAGVSRELANRIESIWNDDRATGELQQDNAQLSEEMKAANRNADVMSDSLRQQDIDNQRQAAASGHGKHANARAPMQSSGVPMPNASGDGGVTGNVSISGLEGRLQLTQEYLDSLQARASIKLNQLKAQKLIDQAKSDFQEYIKTLYSTGRYEQVVLASDFYRKVFNEDEYPVEITNQVNLALESARNVQNSVETFRYELGKNQVASATTRLVDAFSVSELNPALLGLDRSLKERSEDYLTRLDKMENLIEARDFGTLETMIPDTIRVAADFDSTKPLALVNAVKLDSKLHLGKAKLAAQAGDLKLAMEEFETAAKTWPGNPDLQDSSSQFFQTEDVKNESVADFDRLISEKNYRAIFEKQLAFAPAINADSKRQAQFADALEKIKNAEFASEKADQMRNAGDTCGAWEVVELASKDLPGDNKLNSLRADLAGKAAEFVAAVNNAQDAETRSDLGYSLSWYAVAQHYYPPSSIANDGIARISKLILSQKGG